MARKKPAPPKLPPLPTPGDWNHSGGGVGTWPSLEPPTSPATPPKKPR